MQKFISTIRTIVFIWGLISCILYCAKALIRGVKFVIEFVKHYKEERKKQVEKIEHYKNVHILRASAKEEL